MSESSENPRDSSDQMWNTLSMVMLGLTVLTTIYYTVLFVSPSLAPFGSRAEPTIAILYLTPTPKPTRPPTHTLAPTVPPTWTPSPTNTPLPPPTTRPPRTNTPTRTKVIFTRPPTATGSPTPTRHPYPFQLSERGVEFTQYFLGPGCNWLGIGGEVVDMEGEPIMGISVVLNGGGLNNIITPSGSRPEYGPSGWEHYLDNEPKQGTFVIQLWHQGQPVSEEVQVNTTRDCRKNLALLVFEQVWEEFVP